MHVAKVSETWDRADGEELGMWPISASQRAFLYFFDSGTYNQERRRPGAGQAFQGTLPQSLPCLLASRGDRHAAVMGHEPTSVAWGDRSAVVVGQQADFSRQGRPKCRRGGSTSRLQSLQHREKASRAATD